MSAALTEDGSRAVSREVEASASQQDAFWRQEQQSAASASLPSFDDIFEIESTIKYILQHNFQRVALQFPDDLLPDAWRVVKSLQEKLSSASSSAQVFVLGDTTFGSCCVDEVAAMHADADFIVHYGRACLSPTERVPVSYVFTRRPLSVESLVQSVTSSSLVSSFSSSSKDDEKYVVLLPDVYYDYAIESLESNLNEWSQKSQENNNIKYIVAKVDPFRRQQRLLKSLRSSSSSASCCSSSSNSCCSSTPQSVSGCCSAAEPSSSSCCQVAEPLSNQSSKAEEAQAASPSDDLSFEIGGLVFTLPSASSSSSIASDTLILNNPDRCKLVYIGDEGARLAQLIMSHNRCDWWRFDPTSSSLLKESSEVSRSLKRRYVMMQKAKDAEIVGIVVATLGVAEYLRIVSRLKELIRLSGKKSYVFSMGKLNPAKLANFSEVDVYVMIACPENTLLRDSKDFFRPVVTPFELEVALRPGCAWTGEYVTDFRQLLPGSRTHWHLAFDRDALVIDSNDSEEKQEAEDAEESIDAEDARFSLISGTMRHQKKFGQQQQQDQEQEQVSGALVSVASASDLAAPAGSADRRLAIHSLQTRTYRGLDPQIGQTPVAELEEGRRGIARGYTHIAYDNKS